MPTFSPGRLRAVMLLVLAAAPGFPGARASLGAQDPPRTADGATADRHPELRRLSPSEDIWIDPARKEVVVGGVIALDRGLIEVFACPRHTKEHEAIVATSASARLVHAALLAIGLEPGRPVSFDPAYTPAKGPPVAILVRWTDEHGRPQQRRAQELIRSIATKAPLDADWVFAGSVFWKDPADGREYYQADGRVRRRTTP
jgi:glyoxylase-like metal-dependent hydrolase (beta-lactamase superfamily II)